MVRADKQQSISAEPYYRRTGFNCENLLIANYDYFLSSQLIEMQT